MFRPGPLTGSDAAKLNELLRRVEQLDRASASAPATTSRLGGATQFAVPADRPVILAEITADDGATPPVHGAKRKTRAAEAYSGVVENDVVDFIPETLFDKVLSVNETAIAAGTLVHLSPVIDHPGYWWAIEAGSAAPTVTSWKHVVRAASTANGTLATAFEDGDALDGVTLVTGDRILLKNQTTGAENGIYTVNASGAPTRAADADGVDELVGARVWVSEGTKNADTEWTCTTNATITPGSTATTWVQTYPHAFLCEVTTSADPHTVEQKTYSGGAIADSSPAVSFSNCRATTGATNLPVGTVVTRSPLPDSAGNYWITPAGYATGTLPGLVSHFAQTLGGLKTFLGGVTSPEQIGVTGAAGGHAGVRGGGSSAATSFPPVMPTSEGATLAAAVAANYPNGVDSFVYFTQGGSGGTITGIQSPGGGSGGEVWIVPGPSVGVAGRTVSAGRFAYYNAADTKIYTGVSGSTMVGLTVQGGIVVGGTALADPNADRLVFWDDSAGALAYATPSGLEFSTTTFRLVDQGAVTDPTDSTGGTADGTLAAVGDTSAGDESATINNNFADLAAAFAALTAKLRTAGIIS